MNEWRRGVAPELVTLTSDQLLALVESAPDFVAVAAIDNRVLYVNPAGRELVGLASLEEAQAHPIADYLTGEGLRASLEVEQPAVVRDGVWHGRSTLRHFETGEAIPVEITSFVVRDDRGEAILLATFQRDLREQLALEERLRVAQKLEAVGRLAGAVAHDFNNLLMVVLGYAQLIFDGEPPERARAHAGEVLRAANQGSQLVRQLLSIARHRPGDPPVSDVNLIIGDNAALLRGLAGSAVDCSVDLAPGELWVGLDESQLMQILLNLCANARDAMPGGGNVGIRTVRGGGSIVIEFSDSGCGIEPALLPRVLDPFVSTKTASGGTGLGLANVAAIVGSAGGTIDIESRVGAGTAVRIALPEVPGPDRGSADHRTALQGSESVMVVEQDPAVAQVIELALEAEGYRPSVHDDAAAAARADGRPDVIVSGADGSASLELAAEAARRWPGVPVFLISDTGPPDELPANVEFIAKPFLPSELLRRIRASLDRG